MTDALSAEISQDSVVVLFLFFFKTFLLFYGFSAGVAALQGLHSVPVREAFAHFCTVSPCFYNTSGLSVYVFMQVFLTLLGSALWGEVTSVRPCWPPECPL